MIQVNKTSMENFRVRVQNATWNSHIEKKKDLLLQKQNHHTVYVSNNIEALTKN